MAQAQDEKPIFQTDTMSLKKAKILAIPVIFSTPETSFGFGGGGQLFLLQKSNIYNERLSNILFTAIYTLNQQFIIDLKPQIYIDKGDFFLDIAYKFKIYPNLFWGVGANTPESNQEQYDMNSTELRVAFLKRLPPDLNFGLEWVFQSHQVTETAEGGLLAGGDIVGFDKALINGLGVIFNLDSRDDVASPFDGHFLQLNARFSSENFGATQGYNKFITDLRTYRPIGRNSVLALQIYQESTFGEVPFQGMSWYGGGERARGYFRGRFIERHQYVLQAEYRHRFHPRWTVAAFALVGEVAATGDEFFRYMKPAAGGGIRFKLLKDQNTVVRFDYGFGLAGSSGFYFGVNEAF
ncbi:BamA/TamA family outer membrane protein [Persicobacter diffluens]|uniref:BamA/TamA family outer membrane protein n=1 Tax=Persicobacter diffluens TaxID=981 RepID=UPI0030C6CD48